MSSTIERTMTGSPRRRVASHSRPSGRSRSRIGSREPAPRLDLIARVRRQIAEGTFATTRKLEVALDRMIDEVAGGGRSRGRSGPSPAVERRRA